MTLCFQAREVVARRAEAARARGGVADESLLEVLPDAHASGHLLPPPHDGGGLRRTRECRPKSSPPLLCSADLANMNQPRSQGRSPESKCVTLSHFTLVSEIKAIPYWEIMRLSIVRPILMP